MGYTGIDKPEKAQTAAGIYFHGRGSRIIMSYISINCVKTIILKNILFIVTQYFGKNLSY